MNTARNPENPQNHGPHDLGQIFTSQAEAEKPRAGTIRHVRAAVEATQGASLTKIIKALNGLRRGAYRITIRASAEWNEVQIRLHESNTREPIATGFIDRGHTRENRADAAEELRGLVLAYLCR